VTGIPRRSPWLLALARRYARCRLARGLDGLYARGTGWVRALARERPVILAANHVGWWDSFLVVAVDQALGTEGYALMDAESVRRLPFFARLGALPLELGGVRARAGLRAAASRLDRAGRAVWIFPQGRHRPAHVRPLGFQGGVRLLARLAPEAAVVPAAFQYAWGERSAPAAYVHLGEPLAGGAALRVDALEAAVADGLAAIDAALAGDAPPFPALVPPRARRGEGAGSRGAGSARG
jgi:1-acyl-sn-glycerol-3-phosphate acyltransferase